MRILALTLIALLLVPTSVSAQWNLVNDESSIHFISVKKETIAEIHTFKQLTGNVNQTGAISIDIDLASVETNISIRNERMKSMLFNIIQFPKANISGNIGPMRLTEMLVGASYQDSIDLNLSLHGVSQKLSAVFNVTKLIDNRLLVTSVKPVILNTDHYNLTNGVNQLREVAKLPSISSVVPITFSLVFKYKN